MTEVWIRVSPYVLPKILKDGRFKTRHDGVRSLAAADDLDARLARENGQPVVYGYLCQNADGTATHGHDLILLEYGEAAVRLVERVKARTTWTLADSLYQEGVQMRPFDEATLPANLDALIPYVEAQISGGVQSSEIAEVVFQVWEGQPVPSSLFEIAATLEARGIATHFHEMEDK